MPSLMRPLVALILLSIVTTTGCDGWKSVLDDMLDDRPDAGKGGGSGGSGGTTGGGGSGGTTGSAGSGGTTGSGANCTKIDGGGGPTSCKDAATWKKYGTDACAQQNLVLTDIAYGPACGTNFQNATYVCCGGGAGVAGVCDAYTNTAGVVCKRCVDASGVVVHEDCPPQQPQQPPQPPTTCTKVSDGGPSSCKDAATWKQYGATSCARLGLMLSDIAYGTPCGANYQDVVYVCCGTVAPSCSVDIDALGNTCKTCWDAAGAVVESVCKSSGVTCQETAGANGAMCKTCTYPDGRIYSAECNGGSPGGTEICDVKTNADGSVCKICYEPDGTTISSCP